MKNAIVLCSGGLDSVVTAHYVKSLGYCNIKVLFFDYGQKNIKGELKCSKICSDLIGADFVKIRLKELGEISDSLINKGGKFKMLSRKDLKDTSKESEKWYVPCRNLIFLSYALALADSELMKKTKYDVFVGFKNEGKESYPDTTDEFVKQVNLIGEKSCSGKINVLAPLIKKDKEDIIKLGEKIGVDFRDTFSCYTSIDDLHCGSCLACMLRKEGFYWANVKDETKYLAN